MGVVVLKLLLLLLCNVLSILTHAQSIGKFAIILQQGVCCRQELGALEKGLPEHRRSPQMTGDHRTPTLALILTLTRTVRLRCSGRPSTCDLWSCLGDLR